VSQSKRSAPSKTTTRSDIQSTVPVQTASKLWHAVAAIGVLVSATAVLNVVADLVRLPMSHWLAWWLDGYRRLFYPIIDSTVGEILSLFGSNITSVIRDTVVVYSIGYLAFFRMCKRVFEDIAHITFENVGQAENDREIIGLSNIKIAAASAFWIIIISLVAIQFTPLGSVPMTRKQAERMAPEERNFMRVLIVVYGLFLREIIFIVAVVAAAIIFNVAGVLN
jgi:hypothetical protein